MSTATAMGLLERMGTGKSPAKAKRADADLPGLKPHIDQWLEAERELNKWNSVQATAEAQILSAVAPERLRLRMSSWICSMGRVR